MPNTKTSFLLSSVIVVAMESTSSIRIPPYNVHAVAGIFKNQLIEIISLTRLPILIGVNGDVMVELLQEASTLNEHRSVLQIVHQKVLLALTLPLFAAG